jgi:hypothetical protein
MTGFKKDPLRPTSEEERLDEEFSKGLIRHHELLAKEGINTGYASAGLVPPAPTSAEPQSDPGPYRVWRGGYETDVLSENLWGTTSRHIASAYLGKQVTQGRPSPRLEFADISHEEYMESLRPSHSGMGPGGSHMAVQLQAVRWMPHTRSAGLGTPVPQNMIDPYVRAATAAPGGPIGPEMAPLPQVIAQAEARDRALSARLGGLRSAVSPTGNIPSWSSDANRIVTGIAAGAGMPERTELLGSARAIKMAGGYRVSHYAKEETGEITIGRERLRDVQSVMAGAFAGAMKQYGGMDPREAVANVQRSLGNVVKSYIKDMEEEGKRLAAGSPEAEMTGRQAAKRVGSLANKMLYNAVTNLEKSQGVHGAAEAGRSAVTISAADFERYSAGEFGVQEQEALRAAVSAAGGSRAVARGGLTWQMASGGMAQVSGVGPYGGSPWVAGGDLGGTTGGGGGRRGGIWGSNLGGLMYGAYIAKRFWSYTGAPVMRAMEQYTGVQAQIEPMMTGEIPTEGPGAFDAIKARGQHALGEAAYNLVGAPLEWSSRMLMNPGVSQGAAAGGLLGGAALSTSILSSSIAGAFGQNILGRVGARLNLSAEATARIASVLGRGRAFLGAAKPWLVRGSAALAGFGAGAAFTNWINEERGTPTDYGVISAIQGVAQTGLRSATSFGLIGGAAIYAARGAITGDTAGAREAFQGRIAAGMGGAYGRFLSQDYGAVSKEDQDINALAEELGTTPEALAGPMAQAIALTGQPGITGINRDLIATISRTSRIRGVADTAVSGPMAAYVEALGYAPTQTGAGQAANVFGGMSPEQQYRMMQAAQSRAGLASQFRQIVGRSTIDDVSLRSMMGAFDTQQTGQIAFGGAAQLVAGGQGAMAAIDSALRGGMAVAGGQMTQNQLQGGMSMAAMMGDYLGASKYRADSVQRAFGYLSQGQMDLAGGIASGNIGALSFASMTGALPGFEGMAMLDMAGAPMQETNLMAGFRNLTNLAQEVGLGPGGKYEGLPGTAAGTEALKQFWGGWNAGGLAGGLRAMGISETMSSFFEQNPEAGLRDYQQEFSNKMYGFQMAGIGIGQQRIALQRQFMYGGGDWRQPTSDSLWGIQDRMRALQWQGQQASAAFSLERMDVGNQFAIRQEDISGRRMDLQQDYQRWGMGFQRAGMDLSRQFTMENRQFQDQLRSMSTAATLEDFEENIRMSGGRQRRQLITQRERFVSMTNVQDEATERGREQQEEMWAREDEQFEKRREYSESLMALDEEQFAMNVERRETLFDMDRKDLERRIELSEKLHALQDQQLEKQREYQIAQLDLSQKALGIQAAAAAAQKEYNDDMIAMSPVFDEFGNVIKNVMANDPTPMLKALESMAIEVNKLNPDRAESIVRVTGAINNVNTSKLMDLLEEIGVYSLTD